MVLLAVRLEDQTPNCAIKPTPEQALRSNRAVLPARVIAALGLQGPREKKLVAEEGKSSIIAGRFAVPIINQYSID